MDVGEVIARELGGVWWDERKLLLSARLVQELDTLTPGPDSLQEALWRIRSVFALRRRARRLEEPVGTLTPLWAHVATMLGEP